MRGGADEDVSEVDGGIVMDNIELSIKAYIQARKRLQHGYEKYIKICKNAGPNTVILLDNVEPFAALNEAIFWGISLYERQIKHPDDFMLGIKYISNTMKHCEKGFPVFSFCHPAVKVSVKAYETPSGPVIEDAFLEPDLAFGNLDEVPKDRSKNRNWQRETYIQNIQGKSIPEIMDKLDKLLMALYPQYTWGAIH